MVAAEHKPGVACTLPMCKKIAVFAVRAFGAHSWAYACGYHTGRIVRHEADDDDTGNNRVTVEVLGEQA